MFHKIIIAEDYQSTNLSIQKALSDLQIHQTQYTTYCDEAYTLTVKPKVKGKSDVSC